MHSYDGDNNVKECNVDKRGLVISLIGDVVRERGRGNIQFRQGYVMRGMIGGFLIKNSVHDVTFVSYIL